MSEKETGLRQAQADKESSKTAQEEIVEDQEPQTDQEMLKELGIERIDPEDPATYQKIMEYKKKYIKTGGVFLLSANGVDALFRYPNRNILERVESSDTKDIQATINMVQDCALIPEKSKMSELLDRRPLWATPFAKEIVKLGGSTTEAVVKKF